MATIKDVAQLAGVSNGSVSRAYNGYTDIKPETKERIFEAARLLNYVPNANARSLSSKVTNNMGLLVSGLTEGNDKDNLTLSLLKGVYRFALEKNYQISLYTIDSRVQKQRSYSDFCREHNIAGAVLQGITIRDPYFKELVDLKFPCVAIDVPAEGENVGSVSVDNFTASKELMNYVLDCGHCEIIVIAGKKDAAVTIERIAGAYEALNEHGIILKRSHVLYCDYHEETTYIKTKKYLEKHKNTKATAFFCLSDLMALGVYRALRELGCRIPEDFSVVGFDGMPIMEYITPPLTTIKQNFMQFGYEAAALLAKIINNEPCSKKVVVKHELVIRQSVTNITK